MILVQEKARLLHWTLWSQQAILKALELKQGPGYDSSQKHLKQSKMMQVQIR